MTRPTSPRNRRKGAPSRSRRSIEDDRPTAGVEIPAPSGAGGFRAQKVPRSTPKTPDLSERALLGEGPRPTISVAFDPKEPRGPDPAGDRDDPLPAEVEPSIGAIVHLGLTRHEAQVLRGLLEWGPSTATESIQHAGLNRATGYRVLRRLSARGLIRCSGGRPQRFVGLDATKLLDRVMTFWQDQFELHRMLRADCEAIAREAPGDGRVPPPIGPPSTDPAAAHLARRPQLVPGAHRIGPRIRDLLDSARTEIGALLLPSLLPEPHRSMIQAALVDALRRDVSVRLVVDCRPAEFTFVAKLMAEFPDTDSHLQLRAYAPQLNQLVLVDDRASLRCLHAAYPVGELGEVGDLGLASDEPGFVSAQSSRFHSIWRAAVPMEEALRTLEGAVSGPRGPSYELEQWVRRSASPRTPPQYAVLPSPDFSKYWNRV